jgi:hypothetical protein
MSVILSFLKIWRIENDPHCEVIFFRTLKQPENEENDASSQG